MPNIIKKWASQQEDPEFAEEIANPEFIEEGDLGSLDQALQDGTEEGFSPMPPELVAYRLSVWAGQKVSVDNPMVQNPSKYRELVMDMDYPDNIDDAKKNELKAFLILLSNTVSPEHRDNIKEIGRNIIGISEQPKVGNVFVAKGGEKEGLLVGVLEDGFVISNGKQIKAIDQSGSKLDVDIKSIMQMIKSAPKKAINDEQLVNLLGYKLYSLVRGVDGIGLFDLP